MKTPSNAKEELQSVRAECPHKYSNMAPLWVCVCSDAQGSAVLPPPFQLLNMGVYGCLHHSLSGALVGFSSLAGGQK